MIWLDCDGPVIDFEGTAKKEFGVELAPNDFSKWKWSIDGFPTPEEFYAKAKLQLWAKKLITEIRWCGTFVFITKDYASLKGKFITNSNLDVNLILGHSMIEAPDKSIYCKRPTDLLIDDNIAECEAWRNKGGIAYHFDLAHPDPFSEFLKWWRCEK